MSRREYKVAEKVKEIVATELLKTNDPRLNLVTISAVTCTPDLRLAKIYWVVSGTAATKSQVQQAFDDAASYFRRAVAASLNARFTPELRFYYDDTLDTVAEVEKLFEKIRQ